MSEEKLLSRRDWLSRGVKTATAAGLGLFALKGVSDLGLRGFKTSAGITPAALDFAAAEPCTLTCTQTIGPCYFAANLVRRDITEGRAGMPVRLGFRIVDADTCEPKPNVSIDIWHTDASGVYSAPISQMCNGTDPTVQTARFARGIQTSDANGWAYFDTIYPGWYSGRTTHIHATCRISTTEIVTTQFYFWDNVSETIYRNHPNYISRPVRNTTNSTDNILGGSLSRMLPYMFNTRLVNNKYLLATKTIGLRSTATACAA